MVYKDIHTVMTAQSDPVEVLGLFDPKLVKMAPTASNRRIDSRWLPALRKWRREGDSNPRYGLTRITV